MANRYDDYERNNQGRRWPERSDVRDDFDRQDYGRDEPNYRGRERSNWENERERSGGNEWRGDSSHRGDTSYYGQRNGGDWEPRYNTQRSGSNWEPRRNWDPKGGDWQRSSMEPNRESGGNGRNWESGNRGEYSGGYGGFGSYTGFGTQSEGSYSGGAGGYAQQRGRFTGRGPKGYQRSDERIHEDVCERLTQHPEIDATEIEVKVEEGEVTLTGTVDERRAKRLAEDVVENISGVKDVHNQIRVQQRETSGQQQARSEAGTHSR